MKKKIFYLPIFLFTILVIIVSCQKEEWTRTEAPLYSDEEVVLRDGYPIKVRVFTVEPNGVDDTENLQAAFDAAVATGKFCKVRLIEGVYHTSAIFIENFWGRFEGSGTDATIIEFIPGEEFGAIDFNEAPTAEKPWPNVFTFSGGDISVLDMSIKVLDPTPSVWNWFGWEINALAGIIMFTGETVDSKVENVHFEGLLVSDEDGGLNGSNVNNCLYTGSNWDNPWATTGKHQLYSSTFKNVSSAAAYGAIHNSQITIGGSASQGNTFENVLIACEIVDISGSDITVAHNFISNIRYTGISVVQGYFYPYYIDEYPPEASNFMIQHNIIHSSLDVNGVNLVDHSAVNGNGKLLKGSFKHNRIHMVGDAIGILGIGLQDASIQSNRVYGTALHGNYLDNASGCKIVNNNFEALTTGCADVVLLENTSNNRVVCGKFELDVLDLGTDNNVLCPVVNISDVIVKPGNKVILKEHTKDKDRLSRLPME